MARLGGLGLGHGLRVGGGGRGAARGRVLDLEPTYRGAVLDADPRLGLLRAWSNDPASADRVGRYRRAPGAGALAEAAFADLLTFSRASAATDFGADGALVEHAAGVVRQGFDPAALTPEGWQIGGNRTNSIRNPRGEGASAPTFWDGFTAQNGVTPSVVARGREFGMDYVDIRFAGTATATNQWAVGGKFDGVAATNGQTWAGSVYARLVAGAVADLNPRLEISEGSAGAGATPATYVGSTYAPLTGLDGTLRRFTATRATQAADGANTGPTISVAFAWKLATTSGVAYDLTVRWYGPQLELGAFTSSLILPPVGTPAVTARAGDFLSVQGQAFARLFGTDPRAGAVAVEFVLSAVNTGQVLTLFSLDDGGAGNRFSISQPAAGTAVQAFSWVGSANLGGTAGAGILSPGVVHRAAFRWSPAGLALAANGGAPVTATPQQPTGLAALWIGGLRTGAQAFARIRRVVALNYAPSNAELQALSVVGAA